MYCIVCTSVQHKYGLYEFNYNGYYYNALANIMSHDNYFADIILVLKQIYIRIGLGIEISITAGHQIRINGIVDREIEISIVTVIRSNEKDIIINLIQRGNVGHLFW